jgi:putative aldouronate transport system permease protein
VMQVLFTLTFTSLTAYPLSKQRLLWRKTILLFIGFTLLFNGGLIPTFLLIKKLGMLNTMWALVIPGAVNTMYLFIMRTFFEGIPEELEDAATMDGCNPFQVLLKIVLPLSVPVMVTIGLFTAVAQWNSFFNSLIYLTDKNMFPLQIHLRNVVISGSALFATRGDDGDVVVLETIKYSTLMVATAPILLIYPFIQKYFVKGALIGSIK